ncbi:MAG: GntR family transcriptional regulator [Chloroflexi bacterium]|nr:GntR family transcriptional regulator [Chloroflexota bacterium]
MEPQQDKEEPVPTLTSPDQRGAPKLHKQIEVLIRNSIQSGQLKAGDQLPTEAELCQQFKVSRSTVRLALTRLENAGMITRTRGRGTFLRELALTSDISSGSTYAHRLQMTNGGRAQRSSQRSTIGVVLSFASEIDVMQMNILLGIEHAVKSRGYNVLFVRTDEYDENGEAKAIAEMYQAGVSGLIALPIANRATTTGVRMLVEHKVPVVLVDRYLSELETGYVVSDNFAGAYRATEHLIVLGYRAFEFVMPTGGAGTLEEQLTTTSIRDRYDGFCKALQDYGLSTQIHGPAMLDLSSQEGVCEFFATKQHESSPLAIVALHDLIAIPFINQAAKLGLRPPLDFAIVGFDDLPFAVHLPVPLTTVTQPRYDIGFRAGHLLIDKIEGNPIRNGKLSLMVSLVVRESCGAHRLVRQRFALA